LIDIKIDMNQIIHFTFSIVHHVIELLMPG